MKSIPKIDLGCFNQGDTFPGALLRYRDDEGNPAPITGLEFSCDLVEVQSEKKVFSMPIEVTNASQGEFRMLAFDLNLPAKKYMGYLRINDNGFRATWAQVEIQIL